MEGNRISPSKTIIFYDGACPLCVKEMTALRSLLGDKVTFVNALNNQSMADYPDIEITESLRILHVLDNTGQLRLGVDANVYLWALTGKKPWLRVLRWPIIRPIANAGYWFFARYRYQLSKLLTGQSRCKQCEL
ncbi:thiol-disulfide oxidoreductase DCC family protein [Vibrio renipiscarius]|uniref:Thiol-disulfide oxidoreductase n=1 Tax=Vibrio renipiscarius TaxID=1461322 RepID=A0A0C2NQX4_9VIBR|nr:DUF393 domain-containing protein [Vibrio renipiscarius]KII75629.1 thiol-disulfide oxidoreductase [Vibrio renipiscarius]KII81921.1 thiol-disulfide oxidoreductase [Vibrio renipiscarius]